MNAPDNPTYIKVIATILKALKNILLFGRLVNILNTLINVIKITLKKSIPVASQKPGCFIRLTRLLLTITSIKKNPELTIHKIRYMVRA
jgi:hypothetical protein